jgi:hypothetical protein
MTCQTSSWTTSGTSLQVSRRAIGAGSKYATLLGTRTVNDPAGTNATQALLQGTHLHTALGKEFMPGFANGYSDAEIAAVVNFVTGRFGTTASALMPDEVAKRRQEN